MTARPKGPHDPTQARTLPEAGLSIDPEQMGAQFLAEATEQGDFESTRTGDDPSLGLQDAPSDEALQEATWGETDVLWERMSELLRGRQEQEPPLVPSSAKDALTDETDRLSLESEDEQRVQDDEDLLVDGTDVDEDEA